MVTGVIPILHYWRLKGLITTSWHEVGLGMLCFAEIMCYVFSFQWNIFFWTAMFLPFLFSLEYIWTTNVLLFSFQWNALSEFSCWNYVLCVQYNNNNNNNNKAFKSQTTMFLKMNIFSEQLCFYLYSFQWNIFEQLFFAFYLQWNALSEHKCYVHVFLFNINH